MSTQKSNTRRFAILLLLIAAAFTTQASAQTLQTAIDVDNSVNAVTTNTLQAARVITVNTTADDETMISVDGGRSWRFVPVTTAERIRQGRSTGGALNKAANTATVSQAMISPNPTAGITSIRYELNDLQQTELSLHDIHGNEVLRNHLFPSQIGEQNFSFDASALSAGTYFLRVRQSDRIVYTGTIVVAH
jgi:hypothetical protein